MQYDFNLAANAAISMQLSGKFFKYKSGTGPIRVKATKGGYIDLLPGQGVYDIEFNDLSIVDISGAANKGVILAGFDDFRDDRIAGTVDVVDGGYNRTISGIAFASAIFQPGVAGQYSFAQIFNPASSGKRIILSQYDVSSNAVTTALCGIYSVSLGGVTNAPSKLSGGASSSAQMQPFAQVGLIAPNANQKILFLSANTPYPVRLTEPIVLLPGYGFLVAINGAQNQPLTMNAEFTEATI